MQTMLGAWDKHVGAGANMASPLAQRVAINGLCNSYMAFNTNYQDTGLFGVYAVSQILHCVINFYACMQHAQGLAQPSSYLRT